MTPRLALTLALALAPLARAADLTLYPSFAEVREAVRVEGARFDWSPLGDVASYLVPGSLALEAPGVLGLVAHAPAPNLLSAYEGRDVFVRRDGQIVRARVVNAEQNLLEANGQYFQAEPTTISYPSLEGVRLTPGYSFSLEGPGGGGTLAYLTRGLSWGPRYTLAVTGDTARLEAWADVRNATNQPYSAPSLSLFAGDARLASGPAYRAADAQVAAAPAVSGSGEFAGLQGFRFPGAVTLAPRSTTSLRFLEPKIALERVLEYRSGFTPTARTVVGLERVYTVRPDAELPAGAVTVREEGRVVGQASLPNTPRNEAAALRLGADFDLRLTRTVQTLERTQTSSRYKVSYSLTNTKSRPVVIRLRESFSGVYTLGATVLPGLRREADGFTATATLRPGARLEASYTVSFGASK